MEKKVYCLYRVSTTKQVDHDEQNQADIPMQRKACHEFATKMGWTIIREEQENGVSGFKVSAASRDKIQLIKEHAERKAFDVLLVFMFDRIGRRAEETPFVVEWLVEHGIEVWSVNEGEQRFDSHTDYLLNYIRYWQASGESKKTAIRTKTALGQMVMDGRFRGGIAPYGYRLEKCGIINKHKHEVNKLVVMPEEAAVVCKMFELCTQAGYGRYRIADYLNERNIKNRSGDNWSAQTIASILHNITYKGVLRGGTSVSRSFPELRIIDEEMFDTAQFIMFQRAAGNEKDRTMPMTTAGQSLLSGNVFCGHCGGRLVLTTNGTAVKRANGTAIQVKRIRYVCYNKTRRIMECTGQTGYTSHLLDTAVSQQLKQIFPQIEDDTQWLFVQQSYQNAIGILERESEQAVARSISAAMRYQEVSQNAKILQGKFFSQALQDAEKAASHALVAANDRRSLLQEQMNESVAAFTQLQATHGRTLIWARIFDICPAENKKMIVSYMIRRIMVTRGYHLEIEWRDGIQELLNAMRRGTM